MKNYKITLDVTQKEDGNWSIKQDISNQEIPIMEVIAMITMNTEKLMDDVARAALLFPKKDISQITCFEFHVANNISKNRMQ